MSSSKLQTLCPSGVRPVDTEKLAIQGPHMCYHRGSWNFVYTKRQVSLDR